MIYIVHAIRIFEGKTEIGIGSLFQIYDPTSLLFEFANCTSERVEDFTAAAPARDKCPFFVSSVVDQEELGRAGPLAATHGDGDTLMSFVRKVVPPR